MGRSNLYETCCVFCRPLWDVGRLHLSCKGPFPSLNVVNCSDLRPFLVAKEKTLVRELFVPPVNFIEQERKVRFVVLRNLSDAVGFYRFATDCAKGDLKDEGDRQYQPEVTR